MDFAEYPHVKRVRVLKNGLIEEDYVRNGCAETLFPVGCIFKSFLAALVGIAIREGRIGAVTDPVVAYFDRMNHSHEWEKLIIGYALSKTTGLVWPGPGEKLPEDMSEVFKLPFAQEPGKEFMYKPDPQIIVYLLEEIYGRAITEIFYDKIGWMVGADAYYWNKENIEGFKASVELLELLGQLYLNKGMLDGEHLFDEEFYEMSVQGWSDGGFPERKPYGLGWWLGGCAGKEYFMASGFGGQIVAVVPESDMVIIILSDMDRPHPENQRLLEAFIAEN